MPEILEIELYRRGAEPVVGRRIAAVHTPDPAWVREPDHAALAAQLAGATVREVGRVGKVLIIETYAGDLTLRFGMTGRLIVDDQAIIGELEYTATRLDPAWNRFGLEFDGGGSLVVNDPRRLGSAGLDVVLELGVDAFAIDRDRLRSLVRGKRALKNFLLDQRKVAGLGNLLVDELLWRVGLDPARPVDQLSDVEIEQLAVDMPLMLETLLARGGSTSGDFFECRAEGARCPRDGAAVQSAVFGGRTTWWCPAHQR